jgi:hypothetical protein
VISPTPASFESLGCTRSFTNWKNSRELMLEVTPMRRTGSSSSANLVITGGFASFGSRLRTSFTFRWESWSDVLMSAVRSNSMVTNEIPSPEDPRTVEILSIPETASSISFVTAVSTSSGEAPGYTVVIVTTGVLIFGRSSYLSWLNPNTPRTASAAKMTTISVGRLIESSVSVMSSLHVIWSSRWSGIR